MALVEVESEKLSLLERTAQVANTLWNDPEYGMILKEGVKKKFPTAAIPEVDAAIAARTATTEAKKVADEAIKSMSDKLAEFEKKFGESQEQIKKKEEDAAFEAEIESTKKKYNLTNEGMQKVFDRMKAKNSPDVEAAAAWVTDHEPKAPPVTPNNYSPQSMDLYGSQSGDKDWEALNRNPLKWGDEELTRIANDFQAGNFGKYREFGGSL